MKKSVTGKSPEDIYLRSSGYGDQPQRPGKGFEKVAPELGRADLRFGIGGIPFGEGFPGQGRSSCAPPGHAQRYLAGGFEVVALPAIIAWTTHGAFLDTLDLLDRYKIQYVGAGRNIDEARRPAIIEKKGTRIGFLSYLLELPLVGVPIPQNPASRPSARTPCSGSLRNEKIWSHGFGHQEDAVRGGCAHFSYHWGASQSQT